MKILIDTEFEGEREKNTVNVVEKPWKYEYKYWRGGKRSQIPDGIVDLNIKLLPTSEVWAGSVSLEGWEVVRLGEGEILSRRRLPFVTPYETKVDIASMSGGSKVMIGDEHGNRLVRPNYPGEIRNERILGPEGEIYFDDKTCLLLTVGDKILPLKIWITCFQPGSDETDFAERPGGDVKCDGVPDFSGFSEPLPFDAWSKLRAKSLREIWSNTPVARIAGKVKLGNA